MTENTAIGAMVWLLANLVLLLILTRSKHQHQENDSEGDAQ